jgi:predicted amino acid dehydrogenase
MGEKVEAVFLVPIVSNGNIKGTTNAFVRTRPWAKGFDRAPHFVQSLFHQHAYRIPPQMLYLGASSGVKHSKRHVVVHVYGVPFNHPELLDVKNPRYEMANQRVIQTALHAAKRHPNAVVLGLGAACSIACRNGTKVADALEKAGITIPVTNGSANTAVVAHINTVGAVGNTLLSGHTATVVGIGSVGGSILLNLAATEIKKVICVGKPGSNEPIPKRLKRLGLDTDPRFIGADSLSETLPETTILYFSSSSAGAAITKTEVHELPHGAIVVDINAPPATERASFLDRPDINALSGGLIQVPGSSARLGHLVGLADPQAFACLAETVAITLGLAMGEIPSPTKLHTWLGQPDKDHIDWCREAMTRYGFQPVKRDPWLWD